MRLYDFEGGFRLTPSRVITSAIRRISSVATARKLDKFLRNRTAPITDANGRVIVSLTTYGPRTALCHRAISSIAAGKELPRRIILWVDRTEFDLDEYPDLAVLEKLGLEILETESVWGPHKKYFPAIPAVIDDDLPLLTADDDVAYPPTWVSDIANVGESTVGAIVTYRAKVIKVSSGRLLPYALWPVAEVVDQADQLFTTGVSGVLYPPSFLDYVNQSGTNFMKKCPRADDVWLNVHALRGAFPIILMNGRSQDFTVLPGSQVVSLVSSNVADNRNDEQIQQTYTALDVQKLSLREYKKGIQ